jgi:hypothetical protein
VTTPGVGFVTTTLDVGAPTPGESGGEEAEPTIIRPQPYEGPPHLRTGPPQPKRSTAEHGFPKEITRFGRPTGGDINCSDGRCFCTLCNPQQPHHAKDKCWSMVTFDGEVIWCQKPAYDRQRARFTAAEQGRGRIRPEGHPASTGAPSTAMPQPTATPPTGSPAAAAAPRRSPSPRRRQSKHNWDVRASTSASPKRTAASPRRSGIPHPI